MRINHFVFVICIVLAAGLFAQETPDTEAMQKALKKELDMGSVVKSDFRDDTDQKFERIKLTTEQDEDGSFMGTMRFTVELTDKAGETRWGQILRKQAKRPAEYDGKDEWTFEFPHGELDKPKMTAYALEYGWETDKVFTPVVQEFYKVESADEITARNKDPKQKLKITAKTKSFRKESGGE
jgi:hypothetical protein